MALVDFQFYDVVGTLGVVMILSAYFLLQINKLSNLDLSYSMMNLIGAGLILFSLYFEFNFSAALMEGFWVIISLIGLIRYIQSKKSQ